MNSLSRVKVGKLCIQESWDNPGWVSLRAVELALTSAGINKITTSGLYRTYTPEIGEKKTVQFSLKELGSLNLNPKGQKQRPIVPASALPRFLGWLAHKYRLQSQFAALGIESVDIRRQGHSGDGAWGKRFRVKYHPYDEEV